MQHREIDAWLGHVRDELSGEQYDRFVAEAREIAARYPDPDDGAERDAALSATVQHLLGELSTTLAGAQLTRARAEASEALAAARQVARLAALDGMPKARAAREAGIDRMTLLKDMGER